MGVDIWALRMKELWQNQRGVFHYSKPMKTSKNRGLFWRKSFRKLAQGISFQTPDSNL
jgi:hypothetical protein